MFFDITPTFERNPITPWLVANIWMSKNVRKNNNVKNNLKNCAKQCHLEFILEFAARWKLSVLFLSKSILLIEKTIGLRTLTERDSDSWEKFLK